MPERSGGVLSLQRASRVLETIAELDEVGISDLARRLGWTRSMVHRQAATLRDLGYLEQDEGSGRYRLGFKLFELGSRVVRGRNLAEQAAPVMRTLMEATEETVHLAVLDEARCEVIYLHKCEAPQAIRLYTEIGARHPAHCAATGKVLLAHLPEGRLEHAIGRATRRAYTPRTLTSRQTLRAHLETVRRQGYAVDDEEYKEGVRGVAAPVWDLSGGVVGAINAGGPSTRLTPAGHRAAGQALPLGTQTLSRVTTSEGGPVLPKRR